MTDRSRTAPPHAGPSTPAGRNLAEWFRQVERLLRLARAEGPQSEALLRLREELVETFAGLLEFHAPIVLRITPLEVWLRDERVVHGPAPGDALAEPVERRAPFLLYRDGVRGLTFDAGATREDVGVVLDALAWSAGAPDTDEDIVARLWLAELTGLSVELAPLEDCLPGDESARVSAAAQAFRDAAAHDAEGALWPDAGTPASPANAWPELAGNTAAVLDWRARLDAATARPWPERVEGFVDAVLTEQDTPETRALLVAVLASGLGAALQRCAWAEAVSAWDQLLRIDPERRWIGARLGSVLGSLDAETISDRLDAATREEQTQVCALAAHLGAPAVDLLVGLLTHSKRQRVRAAATTALGYVCADEPQLLARYVRDTRWHVARNVVVALGQIGGDEAGELAGLALRHPEARVRRAAIAALRELPPHRRTPLLAPLLESRDVIELRAALDMLVRQPDMSVTVALVDRVSAPDFAARPQDTRLALIAALAELPHERALAALRELLHEGGWFARRTPERNAAAQALAAAGTPQALDVLHDGLRSRSDAVRAACELAIGVRERSA